MVSIVNSKGGKQIRGEGRIEKDFFRKPVKLIENQQQLYNFFLEKMKKKIMKIML